MSLVPSRAASRRSTRASRVLGSVVVVVAAGFSPALAMDGLTPTGQGARQKALAGAGAADSRDASAATLNPAGLTDVGTQVSAAVSAFSSRGGYTSWGAGGLAAPGEQESSNGWTVPANMAAVWRLNWQWLDAVGVTVATNEGLRTHYGSVANSNCPPGFSGVACGGAIDFNILSTTASIAFAKKLGHGLSVGVAPFVTRQTLRVDGLGVYSAFSTDPARFSNMGDSSVWGAGVRGGVQWSVARNFRLGLSGVTQTNMPAHSSYRGLLAEGGDLDIPASMQLGAAWDVAPNLTLMADYKRVWNGSVAALANTSLTTSPFGSNHGVGFGWKDVDIFKVAAEWRRSPDLTFRAGYSHSSSLTADKEADVSIFIPSFVQHHFTAGLSRQLTPNLDLEIAAMYAPTATRTGLELGNPARTVQSQTSQIELTAGVVYRFGPAEAPVARALPSAPEPLK